MAIDHTHVTPIQLVSLSGLGDRRARGLQRVFRPPAVHAARLVVSPSEGRQIDTKLRERGNGSFTRVQHEFRRFRAAQLPHAQGGGGRRCRDRVERAACGGCKCAGGKRKRSFGGHGWRPNKQEPSDGCVLARARRASAVAQRSASGLRSRSFPCRAGLARQGSGTNSRSRAGPAAPGGRRTWDSVRRRFCTLGAGGGCGDGSGVAGGHDDGRAGRPRQDPIFGMNRPYPNAVR